MWANSRAHWPTQHHLARPYSTVYGDDQRLHGMTANGDAVASPAYYILCPHASSPTAPRATGIVNQFTIASSPTAARATGFFDPQFLGALSSVGEWPGEAENAATPSQARLCWRGGVQEVCAADKPCGCTAGARAAGKGAIMMIATRGV